MKIRNIVWVSLCWAFCTACVNELPEEGGGESVDEPILLSFDMYGAELTKALGAALLEDIPVGTKLSVLAYKHGETDFSTSNLQGSNSEYTVESNGSNGNKATGNLTLHRGSYDIYLVSNNSTANLPAQNNDGTISATNGNDLIYNTLRNVTVQPNQPGQSSMSVQLPGPFAHLGARLDLAVKINPDSPVTVTSMTVESIKITGLSSSQSYKLGETDLTVPSSISYDQVIEVKGFTLNTTEGSEYKGEYQNNSPTVILPINAVNGVVSPLTFEISLKISYESTTDKIFTYTVPLSKVFLKAMSYKLLFTLTFYGDYKAADISVILRDYSEQDIIIDNVGE